MSEPKKETHRFVKPLNGLLVRIPVSFRPLSKDGGNVPWVGKEGRYWRRQHRDGSIEIVKPPKPYEPKKEIKETKYGNKF